MKGDYSLGKDIAGIQESLRRMESRLSLLDQRMDALSGSGGAAGAGSFTPVVIGSAPFPKRGSTERQAALDLNWKATDESFSRRVITPDSSAQIALFGYMVGINNAAADEEITDSISTVVSDLYDADRSATSLYYYRPTNYLGNVCVFGWVDNENSVWSWVAVEFTHVIDNPNARFSRTYSMNGELIQTKWGWEPPVVFGVRNYRMVVKYSDCDREWGVGFAFQSLTT